MADDEGVLGKLPNSRPGTRSEKRASADRPGKTASKAAAKAEAGGKPAAKAPSSKPRARAKPAATAKPGRGAGGAGSRAGAERRQPADPPRPRPSGDAVTSVVRGAAAVAVTGVRVAGAVTQEILRRLPRP